MWRSPEAGPGANTRSGQFCSFYLLSYRLPERFSCFRFGPQQHRCCAVHFYEWNIKMLVRRRKILLTTLVSYLICHSIVAGKFEKYDISCSWHVDNQFWILNLPILLTNFLKIFFFSTRLNLTAYFTKIGKVQSLKINKLIFVKKKRS